MKNNLKKYLILLIVLLLIVFSIYFIEPTITGLSHKPSHNPGGGGQGGGGGGDTTTTTGGGGVGVQKIIGIYPQFPVAEETIKNGDYKLSVKITFGGTFTTSANVKAQSNLFGDVNLYYLGGITGIYESNISIRNKEKGRYEILYKAEDNKQEEGLIFVNLNPELKIETKLNNSYNKGEGIEFRGVVKDYKNDLQPNINLTIMGYSQGLIFEKHISTNNKGEFFDVYNIGYADPSGVWNITLSTNDRYGNLGVLNNIVSVKEKGVSYYIVNFMSPLMNSNFKRGDSIPISVEVRERDNLVENATVNLLSLKGDKFIFKEVDNGVYSINYIVGNDDTLGDVRLKVEAVKKIKEGFLKTGGESLPIIILPAEINFNLDSPSRDVVYTNSKLKYLIKLTYSDGSLVRGANINIKISNGNSLSLLEIDNGVYSGEYFVSDNDIGTLTSEIKVSDSNGNIGSFDVVTYVRKRGVVGNLLASFYENIIVRFWWAFVICIIVLTIYFKPILELRYLKSSISHIGKEQKGIISMQIEAEKNYYKKGVISREDFSHIIQEYRRRSADLKEKELKERLNSFKKIGKV